MCIHDMNDSGNTQNRIFSYGVKTNQKPTQQPTYSQDTAGNRLTGTKMLSWLPKVAYFRT